jgi:hypothetical protein
LKNLLLSFDAGILAGWSGLSDLSDLMRVLQAELMVVAFQAHIQAEASIQEMTDSMRVSPPAALRVAPPLASHPNKPPSSEHLQTRLQHRRPSFEVTVMRQIENRHFASVESQHLNQFARGRQLEIEMRRGQEVL